MASLPGVLGKRKAAEIEASLTESLKDATLALEEVRCSAVFGFQSAGSSILLFKKFFPLVRQFRRVDKQAKTDLHCKLLQAALDSRESETILERLNEVRNGISTEDIALRSIVTRKIIDREKVCFTSSSRSLALWDDLKPLVFAVSRTDERSLHRSIGFGRSQSPSSSRKVRRKGAAPRCIVRRKQGADNYCFPPLPPEQLVVTLWLTFVSAPPTVRVFDLRFVCENSPRRPTVTNCPACQMDKAF